MTGGERPLVGGPERWQDASARLSARSIAAGRPTGWFDELYTAGSEGRTTMPWDRTDPHPLLTDWAAECEAAAGRRAVVVGCGLGADAEYVGSLGFATTGFDVSPRVVGLARERYPDSPVTYAVGDLLDPDPAWLHGFDLVVEIITAQAVPDPPRTQMIVNVGRLVAPGGTLLAIEAIGSGTAPPADPPPWPLRRAEVDAFATDGLVPVTVEQLAGYWRAEFRRPA